MMKILHISSALDGGGVDRYIYNYCLRISDNSYDFMVFNEKEGILEKELANNGGKIFHLPPMRNGLINYYKSIKKVLESNHYDIIHSHLGYKSVIALYCAKKRNIKVRIAHAHIAYEPESLLKRVIRKILTHMTMKYATDLFACGKLAGKWMWGKKKLQNNEIFIHNNAINIERFSYSADARLRKKIELGLNNNSKIYGNVGRLSFQKNQVFLLHVFKKICDLEPNSILLLVGRGEDENKLIDLAKKLNIIDNVKFLGVRNDVYELLNVMDVFIFPSIYEGFPFTIIEAQCNGLPILLSDTITKDSIITQNVFILPINNDEENYLNWAKTAITISNFKRNLDGADQIRKAGFDINIETEKLKEYYIKSFDR